VAAITGLAIIDSSGTYSAALTGHGRSMDRTYTSPTPSGLTIAVGDMEPYTDAAGRPNTVLANINLGGGAIGDDFDAGVYTFGRR
jgi:hypothetical protein